MQSVPVGTCSHKRAQYLMNAAAVAGGAIYVACPPVPGLTEPTPDHPWGAYLAVGTLPSGEAVPTRQLDPDTVIERLTTEAVRVARLSEREACLREWADELLAVLGDVCGKLGRDVPADAEAARASLAAVRATEDEAGRQWRDAYFSALASLGGVTTDRRAMARRRRRARRMAREQTASE
ncbi:MAG: hypothetical protein GWN84_05275 [Gammaproteobacteria bacterium]|nr:hypothetical protein [Gammaproteobacteria bacterium]NIR82373.1 hypothetical protein [Gammaproteobacteria bacterium]NIU03518.1 hypothetical protein [Gammaproteobacteria bacterium]NIX84792.1 hypothetical protein [Gammaproteobacteria bacterium]